MKGQDVPSQWPAAGRSLACNTKRPSLFNDRLSVLLKYSTKVRSPWGFTFAPDEQVMLEQRSPKFRILIGLICGSDGVAAISYEAYLSVAAAKSGAIHIACYRKHGEHYEVCGPSGTLKGENSPLDWQTFLKSEMVRR